MDSEPIYTVSEIAELLRVDNSTIQKWCKSGKIPGAYKTGTASNSHWRIPKSGLDIVLRAIGKLQE